MKCAGMHMKVMFGNTTAIEQRGLRDEFLKIIHNENLM